MDCPRRRELALAAALLVSALFPLGAQVLAPRGSAAAGPDGGLPLQPARWARFTTSKGTWMSLDVSPDGQSIVFDMLGDLYTLPITGGKATRLTSGPAARHRGRAGAPTESGSPSSPTGAATTTSGSCRSTARTRCSSPRESTAATSRPTWSPDGKYIVGLARGAAAGLAKTLAVQRARRHRPQAGGGPAGLGMMGPAFGTDDALHLV